MRDLFRVCAYDAHGRWRWLDVGPACFVHDGFIEDGDVAVLAALEARGEYCRVMVIDSDDEIAVELRDGICTWPLELAAIGRETGLEGVALLLRRRIAVKGAQHAESARGRP